MTDKAASPVPCDGHYGCRADRHRIDCHSQPLQDFCMAHGVWFPAENRNCPTCRSYIAAGL